MDRFNIPDMYDRCKAALEAALGEWGLIAVVFLIALSSFGLGRLSATEEAKPVVSVSQVAMSAAAADMAAGGLIVASKTGKSYHYPWCGSASQIKPENRIWFASEEAAEKAGYVPAKSCQGLAQ